MTHVLTPRFLAAPTLARVVRPLVSGRGSVVADPHANVLIITDTVANVGRLLEVVAASRPWTAACCRLMFSLCASGGDS